MTRRHQWRTARDALTVIAALSLAGCMTAIPSVDVTRFHDAAVARSGTVSVVAANPRDAASLEFRTAANAVAAALTRTGYTVLEEGASGATFKAVVELRRETVEPSRTRSPVSVGVGGSTGSYGSGVGLGIGIDLSGKPKPVVTTQLRVQLRQASDDKAIWEGRAETAAKQGSPAAQPGMAAGKLADALFAGFPGVSGKTITVQ
ncbi:MAG TPA: DUF4136 domain-containing protein [Sphingobium sp.]